MPLPITVKKVIRKLHLLMGLSVGAIVFIVSLTGALYVFKDEIQNMLRKDYLRHGEPDIANKKPLPLGTLIAQAQAQSGEKDPILWVEAPMDKSLSYKFLVYAENPDAWHYFNELKTFKTIYVNPFTGKVLSVQDEKNGFFNIVKYIHWSLLLKRSWGKYVVGIPTLLFFGMIVTGIILWWPQRARYRRQRFWFRWSNIKNWQRKNYDLHSITGFYASVFALIFVLSGLFFAYDFISQGVYKLLAWGKPSTGFPHTPNQATDGGQEDPFVLDKISRQVEAAYPDAYGYSIFVGQGFDGEEIFIPEDAPREAYVRQSSYTYNVNHQIYFDKHNGTLLHNRPHGEKNLGEKYLAVNYDIHVGAILGLFGKILAFLASLLCASLPITGFLIWRGRGKKLKWPPPCHDVGNNPTPSVANVKRLSKKKSRSF